MTSKPTKENLPELIAEYQPRLKSFIRNRVGNKDDTEDILQDVFYQLIKTLDGAMNPIEHVSAWLYRVARNTIINNGIKKREVRSDEVFKEFSKILFDGSSPETEYLRSLVWVELESALSELPAEQREVFELTEFADLSMKEISVTTGVPVNTLLSRKHYAVLYLRKRLKDLYMDIVCS
ncbi:MAG: RNA polymerase sigma factor [Bacteroidales bacterium]|nr:RNA polymerase sigma factor [Bacteroidales bacterium]